MDDLDVHRTCTSRLFREHCTFYNGIFVKDLSRVNRKLKNTIIIDNSPTSYLFHPECAIPITSWYDDMADTELTMLTPILEALSRVDDVRDYLRMFVKDNRVLFTKAAQVLRGGKLQERSNSS
jgi:RNA polymerase II subunit A small phosphatase-like protein